MFGIQRSIRSTMLLSGFASKLLKYPISGTTEFVHPTRSFDHKGNKKVSWICGGVPSIVVKNQPECVTIKPFDSDAVRKSVLKTKKLVTIEELSASDGVFNLCLNSIIGINDLRVKQIAIKGFIHGYGSYVDLCQKAGLTESNLVHEVRNIMKVGHDA